MTSTRHSPTSGTPRHVALAARRAAALKLLESDLSLAEVGRRVGVSREAVRLWRKALIDGGAAKLLASSSQTGRPQRLSRAQQRRLVSRLMRSATACGFPDDRWTTQRVVAYVELEFGFTFTVPGLWAMLERFGFVFSREGGWRPEQIAADAPAHPAASLDHRAAVIARHMANAGFSVAEIVTLLRDGGVTGQQGKPVSRSIVERLLDQRRRRH